MASCGGEPFDATVQADDYPGHDKPDFLTKPIERLKPVSQRNFGSNCTPRRLNALLEGYRRPEMMALGGSVFNGISSMQINWWLADWSPPAQVARALAGEVHNGEVPGLKVPAYPHYGRDPYGQPFRREHTFRLGLDLETLDPLLVETGIRRQGRLMEWFNTYKSTDDPNTARRHAFNDNLGYGGAAIEDLLYGTASDYRRRLAAVRRSTDFAPDVDDFWGKVTKPRTYQAILEHAKSVNGITDVAKTVAALTTVFFAQNSSFVLNPTQEKDCIEQMTPLDQVLLRQPKRLLVGVGSNSGLMNFLYTGQRVGDVCGDVSFTFGDDVREWKRYVSIRQTSKIEFLDGMEKLLDKLEGEGEGIETIYVMGQLKPSFVANLEPRPGLGAPGPYPPDQAVFPPPGYYAEYRTAFAPDNSRRIFGRDLAEADLFNDEVNDALRAKVMERDKRAQGKRRFVFVDLARLARYDHKHYDIRQKMWEEGRDASRIVVSNKHLETLGHREVRLDNRTLVFSPLKQQLDDGVAGQQIVQGGIFSLDNLHPSVVGYALLAKVLAQTIEDTEGKHGLADRISPEMAYARQFKVMVEGKQADNHGNVLRRVDPSLAIREPVIRAALDLGSSGKLDCLTLPKDQP
jgi:hypothetical protein